MAILVSDRYVKYDYKLCYRLCDMLIGYYFDIDVIQIHNYVIV